MAGLPELIERIWIERRDEGFALRIPWLFQLHRFGKVGFLSVLLEVRFADDGAAFHRPMVLRAGKWIFFTCLTDRRSDGKIFTAGCAQEVGIEPCAFSNAARPNTPIAKSQPQGIIGQSGLNPNRATDIAVAKFDFDQIIVLDTQLDGRLAADEHCVIPSYFGDGVGHLLKPAVIIVPAIIDAVVAMENQ